jgi:multicomponent Na+:H+ antiporter subunit F
MSLYDFLSYGVLSVLSISVVLVFIRFLKGPEIVDRVVALDLLITIGIAIITVYSIINNQPTFLGTIALSYYLEKRNQK